MRLVDDAAPADLADAIERTAAALAAGRPVPLLIGGFVPRHYVLALAAADGGWRVYEPSSGQVAARSRRTRCAAGRWPRCSASTGWHAVLLPALTEPGTGEPDVGRRRTVDLSG